MKRPPSPLGILFGLLLRHPARMEHQGRTLRVTDACCRPFADHEHADRSERAVATMAQPKVKRKPGRPKGTGAAATDPSIEYSVEDLEAIRG